MAPISAENYGSSPNSSANEDKSNIIRFNITKNELYRLDDGYKTLMRRQKGKFLYHRRYLFCVKCDLLIQCEKIVGEHALYLQPQIHIMRISLGKIARNVTLCYGPFIKDVNIFLRFFTPLPPFVITLTKKAY